MRVDKQRLGALLDKMIRMLSAQQHRPMAAVMARLSDEVGVKPDAVYKWRQGTFAPNPDALSYLVRVGLTEAGMDRDWAHEVLTLAQHPDGAAVLAQLLPAIDPALGMRGTHRPVRHNLPHRSFRLCYGRDREIADIFEHLSPSSRQWIIPITGLGGIGKTALALEVAWRIVEQRSHPMTGPFDAVVFASASQQMLDSRGIADRRGPILTSLDDLHETILEVLEDTPALLSMRDSLRGEGVRAVTRALRQAGHVLLLLDDLDALGDDDLRMVLTFLHDLPAPCKVVVTARFHEDLGFPLRLGALDSAAIERILADECEALQVQLADGDRQRLITASGGSPLAVKWFVSQIAMYGENVDETIRRGTEYNSPLVLFEHAPHAETPFELMQALSLLGDAESASVRELAQAAGMREEQCQRELRRLEARSCVTHTTVAVAPDQMERHYAPLPPLRAYVEMVTSGETAHAAQRGKRRVGAKLGSPARGMKSVAAFPALASTQPPYRRAIERAEDE